MLVFQHKREGVPGTAAAIFDHQQRAAGSRWLEEELEQLVDFCRVGSRLLL
jgi:hypothetical protein